MFYLTNILTGYIGKTWSTPTKNKIYHAKNKDFTVKENTYGKYRYDNMPGMTSRPFNNGIDRK